MMSFEVENIITILVALIMGLPGIISVIKAEKAKRQYQKIDMVEIYIELLGITSTLDTVLQKIFINNPEINGDLKREWLAASGKLQTLLERTKQKGK